LKESSTNVAQDYDKLNATLDDWLNDKGLNLFLSEFKQGNMIGAKGYCSLTYLDELSDMFESKIII